MLGGGKVRRLYELHGQGKSIRGMAAQLGISRNTVRKYVRSEVVPREKVRPKRVSKLEPYEGHIQARLAEGVSNCVVLLREIRALGYRGGYTILKDYVQPRRRPGQPAATVRFETEPGEQAQVDFGTFRYRRDDGSTHQVYAFVMVLSWSRAMYVEFVTQADLATFLRCHWNAFTFFGGVPAKCLYDNAKVVVLGRDEAGNPVHPVEFLDFALRTGFAIQLCRPYRAQTKGKVESGIKYVRGSLWSTLRFRDLADLNVQARQWLDGVANVREHGTTGQRPLDRLVAERRCLRSLPAGERIEPYLWSTRQVGRDGFVRFEKAVYGVPWQWAGTQVQVRDRGGIVEVWSGQERLAVHPRATRPGERFVLPGQWAGLDPGESRPGKEALAWQVPSIEVERRALASYEALLAVGR
jgi:transposase